jgi:hypothetical protein
MGGPHQIDRRNDSSQTGGGVIGCHRNARLAGDFAGSTDQTGSHFCTAHIHTDEGSVPRDLRHVIGTEP